MSWTETDLETVRAAKLKLATGKSVVRVTLSSGKTIEYGRADLRSLQVLESEIRSELDTSTSGACVLTHTSKGL